MKFKNESYQLVVCGGGLAGISAAVSAARLGIDTCIIQDRALFGGNSSSEIRVTPHGAAAFHSYARETGVISELLIEERAKNHEGINENGWTNSVWDMVLYDLVVSTENLSFHLNTSIVDVEMKDENSIGSVKCNVSNSETNLSIRGDLFIDCTGDGIVAFKAGCEWRSGSEASYEFNEKHAPKKATSGVMGSSIHFKAINMGYPVPFERPIWAVNFDDPDYFYKNRRPFTHTGHTNRYLSGYWWLEISTPYHTIYDNEKIRHELTRYTLGVWDWIKNKDPKLKKIAENYALEWIGQVPGKRESRRIMGKYILNENDILNKNIFNDEIAFGGWYVDVHQPGGLLITDEDKVVRDDNVPSADEMVLCGPFGIPLRTLISKDVNNLLMAGRNVSATQIALGSIRVMGTTAIMGQAAGTAAAISLKNSLKIEELVQSDNIVEIQQSLLRSDCFLVNYKNEDNKDLAPKASVRVSSEDEVSAATPNDVSYHKGLKVWKTRNLDAKDDILHFRRGQWIAIGSDKINTLSVLLSNNSNKTENVKAKLYLVDHIWDYRTKGLYSLGETNLKVKPGRNQWIDWDINIERSDGLKKNGYVRLDLFENDNIEWHRSNRIIPGHVSAFLKCGETMQRYDYGLTMSFSITPAQKCFSEQNIINGVTRHYKGINMWRSKPSEKNPWIELNWDRKYLISEIDLTFGGNLLREYHAYEPFYRDPQCVKDYTISVWDKGSWIEIINIKGNYQRLNMHKIDHPISTDKLKINILETNGDPAASVFEIRCYE